MYSSSDSSGRARKAHAGPAAGSSGCARPARGPSASRCRGSREAEEERAWAELVPHLPEGARLLWRALGDLARFKRLLADYGGRTLRVPAAVPPPGHALRRLLGAVCLGRLVAALGGTEVYVPTCRALLGRLRQQEIIRDFRRATGRGASSVSAVAALAGRYGLSDRRIWQILKTTAEAPRGARALRRLREAPAQREAGNE